MKLFGRRQVIGVTQRLQGLVRTDQIWVEMMMKDDNVRNVDFSPQNVKLNSYDPGTDTTIEVDVQIGHKLCLILLFPGINDQTKRVVYTDDHKGKEQLKGVNVILNERMTKDPACTAQVAICYHDYVYRITGVTGILYVLWAVNIDLLSRGESELAKMPNLPILVNTDGYWNIKAVYGVFPGQDDGGRVTPALFMCRDDIKWSVDITKGWLSLEQRPVIPDERQLTYLSSKEQDVRRMRTVVPIVERSAYNKKKKNETNRSRSSSSGGSGGSGGRVTSSRERNQISLGDDTDDEEEEISEDDAIAAFFGSRKPNRSPSRGVGEEDSSASADMAAHLKGNLLGRLDGSELPQYPGKRKSPKGKQDDNAGPRSMMGGVRTRTSSDASRVGLRSRYHRTPSGSDADDEHSPGKGTKPGSARDTTPYSRKMPAVPTGKPHNSLIPIHVPLGQRRTGSKMVLLIPSGTPYNSADYEEVGMSSEGSDAAPASVTRDGNDSAPAPVTTEDPVYFDIPLDSESTSRGSTPRDDGEKLVNGEKLNVAMPEGMSKLDTSRILPPANITPPSTGDEEEVEDEK